jgi:hypothetical protein
MIPICTHYEEDDTGVGDNNQLPCFKPATHYSCKNFPQDQKLNACEKHKCRCKQPT